MGISVPFSILAIVLVAMARKYILNPFIVNPTSNMAVTMILSSVISIASNLLSIHIYTTIRIVTKKFTKKVLIIYMAIFFVFILSDVLTMLMYPESRGEYNYPISISLYIVGGLVTFFIMRKLLLRKAEQHETMEG